MRTCFTGESLYLGRDRITMTMRKGRQSSLRIIDIDGAGLSRPNCRSKRWIQRGGDKLAEGCDIANQSTEQHEGHQLARFLSLSLPSPFLFISRITKYSED